MGLHIPLSLRLLILLFLLLIGRVETRAQERTAPPPQVAISPPRFEIELGKKPALHSFRVVNMGDDPMEIQVSVAHWQLDENSQVEVIPPTEQSLDQWMIVNPLNFTVAPRQSQTVRFSVRPRVEPESGEHRAMIYLDQVLSQNNSGGLRLRFRYGVAVYAFVGKVARQGVLHGVDVSADRNKVQAAFDISSVGTAHVRMSGSYTIWPAAAYPGAEQTRVSDKGPALPEAVLQSGELPSLPILPGFRRQLLLSPEPPLPPGTYILDLNGTLGDQSIDLGLPFEIGVSKSRK